MATKASTLLRVARKASLASRAAAASASRAAAMASRSARAAVEAEAAARAACCLCSAIYTNTKQRDGVRSRFDRLADYAHVPRVIPTDKDLESDEALRSFYQRWCKAFSKERDQRDPAEMDRRFKLFRDTVESIHRANTSLPADPEEAAIYRDKRREAELLLSKGEDVSHLDECYRPAALGAFADGDDPYLDEFDMERLKAIEQEASLGKSQTLNEMN